MTIGGATRVACVIGDPVEHSRSPLMHNAAAAALGLDRVYVALRVAPADLEAAIRGLAALGFDGANVTLPHKAAAAALCDELGAEARDAGAVNTLSFAAGVVRGDLTDGLGLIAALAEVPERAVVLGAGGSTRAAAAALLRAGTRQLTIVARRPEAAAELAGSLAALEPAARVEAAAVVPAEQRRSARQLHARRRHRRPQGASGACRCDRANGCRGRFRLPRRRVADAARRSRARGRPARSSTDSSCSCARARCRFSAGRASSRRSTSCAARRAAHERRRRRARRRRRRAGRARLGAARAAHHARAPRAPTSCSSSRRGRGG